MTALPPIEAKALLSAVTEANRGMSRQTRLPSGQFARLEVKNDGLTVSRFDGHMSASVPVRAGWVRSWRKTPGPGWLPARQLAGLLAECSGEVTVTFAGVVVEFADSDGFSFQLVGCASPDSTVGWAVARPSPVPVRMPEGSLSAARRVAFATSDDPSRPILECVHFDGPDVVATDSYRMAWHASDQDHPIQGMVPAKILPLIEPGDEWWSDEDAIVWGHEGTLRRTAPVGGECPNWRVLWPERQKPALLLSEPLLSACRATIALHSYAEPVVLAFTAGQDVTAKADAAGVRLGSAQRKVGCTGYDGPDIPLAFNPHYLAEIVRHTTQPDGMTPITPGSDPLKPVVFGVGPFRVLLMPVRAAA